MLKFRKIKAYAFVEALLALMIATGRYYVEVSKN